MYKYTTTKIHKIHQNSIMFNEQLNIHNLNHKIIPKATIYFILFIIYRISYSGNKFASSTYWVRKVKTSS